MIYFNYQLATRWQPKRLYSNGKDSYNFTDYSKYECNYLKLSSYNLSTNNQVKQSTKLCQNMNL